MQPPSTVGPRWHAVRRTFHLFCLKRLSILISTYIRAEWAYGVRIPRDHERAFHAIVSGRGVADDDIDSGLWRVVKDAIFS